MNMNEYSDDMAEGYMEAALFTADESIVPPCSGEFPSAQYLPKCSKAMRAEADRVCRAFYASNAADLTTYGAREAGHDLWYTQGRHGCGFWEADHCTKEEGERLTTAAHNLGERSVYRSRGWFNFDT